MIRILEGDCLDVMRTLDAESIDTCVTDPPYHLTTGKAGGSGVASLNLDSPAGRSRVTTGFMGKAWDGGDVAFRSETWAEVLRVLKPGGHLLSFGGTRTYHRMAVAIEDAGFEIRDQIAWIYGSGFPKSHDVSKALDREAGVERPVIGVNTNGSGANLTKLANHGPGDTGIGIMDGSGKVFDVTAPATDAAKEWEGWGTALKPAMEPIVVARKPLIGTVADNVQAHRTGALNIDGCRVEASGRPAREVDPKPEANGAVYAGRRESGHGFDGGSRAVGTTDLGRWPANVVHDGSDEVLRCFPDEAGAAARFFYCAKASRSDREDGLDASFDKKPLNWSSGEQSPGTFQSENTDRSARNNHPTVKPTDLMRWLVRLVTPPHGVVLDPFMGSGSTGRACAWEGFAFIGIEREAEYAKIAAARIASAEREYAESTRQGNLFASVG